MSAHETCPAIPSTSSTENSAPPGDPQNVSQVVVKKENQENLYIDFASDTPPVGLAASQQLTNENSNNAAGPVKKVDPRQQWINTDRAKPYFCKLCDFNMESMEVSVMLKNNSLPEVCITSHMKCSLRNDENLFLA